MRRNHGFCRAAPSTTTNPSICSTFDLTMASQPANTSTNNNARNHQKRRRHNQNHDRNRAAAANSLPTIVNNTKCSVCTDGDNKYKCPKCRAAYCSIACCRKHKQEPGLCVPASQQPLTAASESNVTATSTTSCSTRPSPFAAAAEYFQTSLAPCLQPSVDPRQHRTTTFGADEDHQDDDWKVSTDMIQALQTSDWLRQELRDQSLRAVITGIVQAPNLTRRNKTTTLQEDCLDQLRHASPEFRQFTDKLLVLTGNLQRPEAMATVDLATWLRESSTAVEPLTLKPLPSKRKRPVLEPVDAQDHSDSDSSDGSADSSDDSSEASDRVGHEE